MKCKRNIFRSKRVLLTAPAFGYGASVETDGGVCIGGSSTEGHFADVFRLAWRDGEVQVDDLPSAVTGFAGGRAGRSRDLCGWRAEFSAGGRHLAG